MYLWHPEPRKRSGKEEICRGGKITVPWTSIFNATDIEGVEELYAVASSKRIFVGSSISVFPDRPHSSQCRKRDVVWIWNICTIGPALCTALFAALVETICAAFNPTLEAARGEALLPAHNAANSKAFKAAYISAFWPAVEAANHTTIKASNAAPDITAVFTALETTIFTALEAAVFTALESAIGAAF